MGRTVIDLDPAGYFYLTEPRVDMQWSGTEIFSYFYPKPFDRQRQMFYNPPGSDWLLPFPSPLKPDWQKDATLDTAVVRLSKWTMVAGINAVEYEPKPPGGPSYPDNQWIEIPQIPGTFTPSFPVGFASMFTAVQGQLPSGFGVVGFASQTPNSRPFAEADYAPYFQVLPGIIPYEVVAFGWAQYACLIIGPMCHVFRDPDQDGQNWQLLHSFHMNYPGYVIPAREQMAAPSLLASVPFRREPYAVMALPVGPDRLYMHTMSGAAVPVRIPKSQGVNAGLTGGQGDTGGRLFKAGSWWIASAPNARLTFQMQVICYEYGLTSVSSAPHVLFDLGINHKPTVAPAQTFGIWMGSEKSADYSLSTGANGQLIIENGFTRQRIELYLVDDVGSAWVSDGTRRMGHLILRLKAADPSDPGGQAVSSFPYLAPAIKLYGLVFPAVRAARANSLLRLTDLDFISWRAAASRTEPDGGGIEIELLDRSASLISASGHDLRDNYPVHVLEDVDNDGVYESTRARAWMRNPNLQALHRITGADASPPTQSYLLSSRGLLTRLDQDWEYLPQLIDPTGSGHLTHRQAVSTCIEHGGFNPADGITVSLQSDFWEHTQIGRLPGTPAQVAGASYRRFSGDWAPDDEDTMLGYVQMVTRDWRGWTLYTKMTGLIRYELDKLLSVVLGSTYTIDAVLYRSRAEASAAGRPEQCFFPDSPRIIDPPRANVVRISGVDEQGDPLPSVIARDTASISGPIAGRNYVGERRTKVLRSKMAVGVGQMRQLAFVYLQSAKHRGVQWTAVTVPLPPWLIGAAGIDAGSFVTLAGRGNYLVDHLECEQIRRNYIQTRLMLQGLPA